MSPQCDCRCTCLFVVMAGQETVAFILTSLILWMTWKVKMKPGNLILLSLTSAAWFLSSVPALQWWSLKGHAGAAEHQDAARSPGKELPGELQHKSRTGGSLAKPTLCCHTSGLQVIVGARGETEVLLITANWDNNRGVWNIECAAALLQLGLTWPDQFGIYWHGSGNENKDWGCHTIVSLKKPNQPNKRACMQWW